jgi:translation initiation factor IF-3
MASRRRRFRYRPKPQVKKPPANEEITASEVRLVGSDGSQLGVMSKQEAVQRAEEEGSDLVMVAEKATPPVVRVMDLGKHLYEKRKKDAKQKAKSKGKDIKGVRIGFKTDEHDWEVRLRQADKFLQAGHKVKLEVRLRGREKQRFDLAEKRIQQFIQEVPSGARQEDKISRSHHGLSVILTAAK